jgi:hypothetical protein
MSVATEFAPVVFIPEPARERERPLADVIPLYLPSDATEASPVRLTRRGVVVLAAAVALLAGALVWLAWLSAPAASTGAAAGSDTVTVQTGDTLWSIASRVAPDRDPRAEIATLQKLNHLTGVGLVAGQVLQTR